MTKLYTSIINKKMDSIIPVLLGGTIKNIVVLTGAGVSCASGIPDFRSPGGLYDTLRPELLTASALDRQKMALDATQVVSFDMFSHNQFPYLEVRRPFILGTAARKWKPTISHFFFKVLHDKGLLRRLYTQNIDGLDHQLGISDDLIVNVHGSIGSASCELCKHPYNYNDFCHEVRTKIKDIYNEMDSMAPSQSTNINCNKCGKPYVKPDTVLYGRNLPQKFFNCLNEDFPNNVDLLIIAGTSLTVSPASNLPQMVSSSAYRVLINLTPITLNPINNTNSYLQKNRNLDFFNLESKDIFIPGECDSVFLGIAHALGWLPDLYQYVSLMAPNSARLVQESFQLSILKECK